MSCPSPLCAPSCNRLSRIRYVVRFPKPLLFACAHAKCRGRRPETCVAGSLAFPPHTSAYQLPRLTFACDNPHHTLVSTLCTQRGISRAALFFSALPPPQLLQYFRQDVTSIPPQQGRVSCETCSGRRPHDAACTYVVADDPPLTAMDYYRPPGASPGTLFAVMDPVSCRCTTTGQHDGRGGGGASGGAENEFHKGRETHDPPILWPVQGNKIAYKRDRGPVFHNLDLKSAYAQQGDAWGTGEPAFSSYHHLFKVTTLTLA